MALGGITGWHATDALYQMCQWVPPWTGHQTLAFYADLICGGVIILGLIGLSLAIKKALDNDPRQLMSLGMVWITQVDVCPQTQLGDPAVSTIPALVGCLVVVIVAHFRY